MLLNFQKQFVAKILRKEKRHTIRAKRKRRPRVGEICHNYTGLRQKGARLLGRWPCVKVQDVMIDVHPITGFGMVFVDFECLSLDEREALAISDGFVSFSQMLLFWKGRLPFVGDMIHWDPDQPAKWTAKSRRASKAKRPAEGVKRK